MAVKRKLRREKDGRFCSVGLPSYLVEEAGIANDDEVELCATKDGIRIMKVKK